MKAKHIAGGIVIAVCLVVAVYSLKSSLTPYVSFEEARASGRTVQVAGALVEGSLEFNKNKNEYSFTLSNPEGDTIHVSTQETLPSNFQQSTTVVAIGDYHAGAFVAERILVKCPSKYEREHKDDVHPGEKPQ